MSQLKNYNKNETVATGFVRPKITALFFDKIWIPESLLNISFEFESVPKELLVLEEKEIKIKKSLNKTAGLNYKNAMWQNYAVALNAGDLYRYYMKENVMIKDEYIYSKHRNHAILVNSENFNRKYNIHISPVFHDLTEFEKEIDTLNYNKLYKNNSITNKFRKPNLFLNKDAFSICIQDFPFIKEEALSWEQVVDFREDKNNVYKLKQFSNWTNRFLKNTSPNEIRETLELELENYKRSLKEHGIKTVVGAFSTVVSGASSIANIINQADWSLLPMLSIMAVSLNFTVNTYFSNLVNPNNPIAYLYQLENIN